MKPLAPILFAVLLSLPVPTRADAPGLEQRLEELRDEAGSLLREFFEGIEPQLDALGPRLRELAEKLGGMAAYHPPEVLPNGDIILRRRQPLEDPLPEGPAPDDDSPDAEHDPLTDSLEL